jgi:RimJ/RimL family protein N-acetyltransferase
MKLDFNREYVLENRRVRLTPIKMADLENLVPYANSDSALWTYSLFDASSPEKMKIYIEKALEGRQNKHAYAFIVFDKQAKTYVGCTRFYAIQVENSTLNIGYTWYGKEFQGTGINKHCKYLLLEFAFDVLKMRRVEFRADSTNLRSISAMQSIGCSVEGVLRSNMYKPNGERRDTIVLSILSDEWNYQLKQQLKDNLSN